jgi:hypothetical protein
MDRDAKEQDGIFVDTTTRIRTTATFDETRAEMINDPLFRVLDSSSLDDDADADAVTVCCRKEEEDDDETETEDHDGSDGLSMNTLPVDISESNVSHDPFKKHRTRRVRPEFAIADGLEWQQHRQPKQQRQQQQQSSQQRQRQVLYSDREAPLLQTEWSTPSPASSLWEQQQQQQRKMTSLTLASLCSKWLGDCAWPGIGLFCESYLLLAVGTLVPIWEQLFPNCFHGKECAPRVLNALPYSVVMGIMCGMILVGCRANRVGRRLGSIFTASLMAIGSTGVWWSSLALVQDNDVEYMYKCMNAYLFLYGMGVGGEYPLSAAWATETAMLQQSREKLRSRAELYPPPQPTKAVEAPYKSSGPLAPAAPRIPPPPQRQSSDPPKEDSYSSDEQQGSSIQRVFLMQGLGVFVTNIVFMALLILSGQAQVTDPNTYDPDALLGIWRVVYGIGTIVLFYVLIARMFSVVESQVWLEDKHQRDLLRRRNSTIQNNYCLSSTGCDSSGMAVAGVLPSSLALCNAAACFQETSSVSSMSTTPSVRSNDQEALFYPIPLSSEDAHDHHWKSSSSSSSSTWLLLQNYGVRLGGTSLCWLFWNIASCGNKLLLTSFFLNRKGDNTTTTLLELVAGVTLNSLVDLFGYMGAALVLQHHPTVGRVRFQLLGFLCTGSLFVTSGFLLRYVESIGLYWLLSFLGQLGPNCTTFLIPAEIFPTELRTMCHGISGASGKVGTLAAAVLFHRISADDMFLVSGYACFAALAVTIWTIPESTGLDLHELDRKWIMILEGRKGEYIGAANDPKHLSIYERTKLGVQC